VSNLGLSIYVSDTISKELQSISSSQSIYVVWCRAGHEQLPRRMR
jgi:hypothetical protein